MEEDPSETVELSGFLHLVQLFRPFDDTFVGVWNKTREGCTTDWLVQLQKQLSNALPSYIQSTETQAVDLRMSQQWLKTMIWQLSISQGYLSSQASDQSMTFNFPIELSRDMVAAASNFSQMAMEVHGIGLVSLPRPRLIHELPILWFPLTFTMTTLLFVIYRSYSVSQEVFHTDHSPDREALRCRLHIDRCYELCP